MAAPYSNVHVALLSRMGRRRSRSLTLPNKGPRENIRVQSVRRKESLARLQKERLKQKKKHDERDKSQNEQQHDEEEHHQPTVSRLAQSTRAMSIRKMATSAGVTVTTVKKELSSTPSKTTHVQEEKDDHHQPTVSRLAQSTRAMPMRNMATSAAVSVTRVKKELSLTPSKASYIQEDEEDHHQSTVSRLAQSNRAMSMRKMATSAAVSVTRVKKELSSTPSKASYIQEDEQNHTRQVQVTHIPRSESTILFKELNPTTLVGNGSSLGSSQTSSANLILKSEKFDQEFFLNDSKDHVRRNDVKDHGCIKISEREKYYNVHGKRLYATSSVSLMTAIIGIIIAIIAFAFGLTALILVLLLRSTVDSKLATNSTTSSSSSSDSLPSQCSAYTTLDDPTRNIAAVGYALGCDTTAPFINRTYPVWIRFMGTGGTELPLQTPGMNLCGSEGTGWYDGTMPSSTGQVLNGTACFTWYTSICRFSSSISVANCGSFYIYYLPPPPACMMRYCTI